MRILVVVTFKVGPVDDSCGTAGSYVAGLAQFLLSLSNVEHLLGNAR